VLSNYHNGAEELTSSIMSLLFDKPYSLPTVADANFRLGYRLHELPPIYWTRGGDRDGVL